MFASSLSSAAKVLLKKPFKLWGISLLAGFFSWIVYLLCGVIPALAICISLLISVSMTMVYLHGLRGDDVKVVQLFDCFRDWSTIRRVLCGMGWRLLWLFLWGLIPFAGIVFVVIKSYQWRLVPYILVQEPDVKPTEALKVSEKRTKGFVGVMFLTDLAVYGGIFVTILLLALLCMIPFVQYLFYPILFAAYLIVVLFADLYLGLVKASYYELINAKLNSNQ